VNSKSHVGSLSSHTLYQSKWLFYVRGCLLPERPDPPEDVTAFNTGSRWIALRWTSTFDGNRPVLGFMVYICDVNNSGNFTLVTNLTASTLMTKGNSFMYNVSGEDVVLPFTQYSFRVVSCNEIGCSEQSPDSPVVLTGQDSEFNDIFILATHMQQGQVGCLSVLVVVYKSKI